MHHAHFAKIGDRRCRRTDGGSFEASASSSALNESYSLLCYMRLPLSLLQSRYFLFGNLAELEKALGDDILPEVRRELLQHDERGLPPVVSREVLGAMLGINAGLIWSMENRPRRYYRRFYIPKGRSHRVIDAPRVGLKLIQKWLSYQLATIFNPAIHVFGFVPGRSHLQAAKVHVGSRWVYSLDIVNFFPSTPQAVVVDALRCLGFSALSADLISKLTCLDGALAQGAPSSPVLSNICFQKMDEELISVASAFGIRLSRYADDVVFSGTGDFPAEVESKIAAMFAKTAWQISPRKTELAVAPKRLKVHGLLVHGDELRLTKGYRNRIRAFEHLIAKSAVKDKDLARIRGHLTYARGVSKVARAPK